MASSPWTGVGSTSGSPSNKRQHSGAMSPEPDVDYGVDPDLNRAGKRISERRQREWLRRSKTWADLPATEWKAKRVLGGGGQGICGLWEYIGKNPKTPGFLVVKQVVGKTSLALRHESKFLRDIQEASGTEHVVKLYKSWHSEGGTGTSFADPHPVRDDGTYDPKQEVSRIYIEYCEKGDLSRKWKQNVPIRRSMCGGF